MLLIAKSMVVLCFFRSIAKLLFFFLNFHFVFVCGANYVLGASISLAFQLL